MNIRQAMKQEYDKIITLRPIDILERIRLINGRQAVRNKALVAFLYLTGCRVEECVKYNVERNLTRRRIWIDPTGRKWRKLKPIEFATAAGNPIRKSQIEHEKREGYNVNISFLKITNVRTLKRRLKQNHRTIIVPIYKEEIPFINILYKHLNTLGNDDFLFNITRNSAGKILNKIGLFPHWLRHCRNTFLASEYNWSSQHIKEFNNWASSVTADYYVHLNAGSLLKAFMDSIENRNPIRQKQPEQTPSDSTQEETQN